MKILVVLLAIVFFFILHAGLGIPLNPDRTQAAVSWLILTAGHSVLTYCWHRYFFGRHLWRWLVAGAFGGLIGQYFFTEVFDHWPSLVQQVIYSSAHISVCFGLVYTFWLGPSSKAR